MKRLIINFRAVEATEQNLAHSVSVAAKYAAKHPDADRVSISWNSPTELYAFTGKRHWDSIVFYSIEWVKEIANAAREAPRTIPPD